MTREEEVHTLLTQALAYDDPTSFVMAQARERPELLSAVLALLDAQAPSHRAVSPTNPVHVALATALSATGAFGEGARLGPYLLGEWPASRR